MEELLVRVTQQAMNYAIRSGIAITASYAFSQSTRLLRRVEESKEKIELQGLHQRLESKIKIISPAIDLIELIAARGNTTLETAVSLIKSLRWDIQALGHEIAAAAAGASSSKTANDFRAGNGADTAEKLKHIIASIKQLLSRIEDAVPLINLAITTSGANLSTSLPHTVSPSRLLQASTFITAGDTQYSTSKVQTVQIGPTFTLSLYMLFAGHVRPQNEEEVRRTTWKEVIHKARVKLVRMPLDNLHKIQDPKVITNGISSAAVIRGDEFAYQLQIIEDLEDGRFHDDENGENKPGPYDDVALAGIKEPVPIHEISKIFYADTGKILNIGGDVETNSPVLLLKRDLNSIPPRRMLERSEFEQLQETEDVHGDQERDKGPDPQSEIDAQLHHESRQSSLAPEDTHHDIVSAPIWRIPPDLDPEWLAFEVYADDTDLDTESEKSSINEEPPPPRPQNDPATSNSPGLTTALSNLQLQTPSPQQNDKQFPSNTHLIPTNPNPASPSPQPNSPSPATLPAIRTSLSLLETMLRLLSLQQFQQQSHLSIPDELLSFFLSEATATTGAAQGDEVTRRRMRATAVRNLGFDPYDESPIKPRGEQYQSRGEGAGEGSIGGEPGYADQYGYADEGWAQSRHLGDGTGWTPSPGSRSHASSAGRRNLDEGYDTRRFSSPAAGGMQSPSPSPSVGKWRPGRGESSRGKINEDRRGSPLVRQESVEERS